MKNTANHGVCVCVFQKNERQYCREYKPEGFVGIRRDSFIPTKQMGSTMCVVEKMELIAGYSFKPNPHRSWWGFCCIGSMGLTYLPT